MGEGIADFDVAYIFDAGDDVADVSWRQHFGGSFVRRIKPDATAFGLDAGHHEFDLLTGLDGSFHDAHERHDTAVGIKPRVYNERLKRCIGVSAWRREFFYDGFENQIDADASFSRDRKSTRLNSSHVAISYA